MPECYKGSNISPFTLQQSSRLSGCCVNISETLYLSLACAFATQCRGMNGRQVYSNAFMLQGRYAVDVSAFAPGNYLVKAVTESQTETFKLFINKK